MSTVMLDSGDQGIQWVDGLGFRPIDLTEELPGNNIFCGQTQNGNQCEELKCSLGKGSHLEKWFPPMTFAPPFVSTPDNPIIPVVPVSYSPPTFMDYTLFPPIWWCCTNTTTTTTVVVEENPSPVPLGDAGLFLMTAIIAIFLASRYDK